MFQVTCSLCATHRSVFTNKEFTSLHSQAVLSRGQEACMLGAGFGRCRVCVCVCLLLLLLLLLLLQG
jgi:hypothetical protein